MNDDAGIPRCVRCGYALVGNPPPRRCPECGHQARMHERWIEGELHREGPSIVLPVLIRTTVACGALLVPLLLGTVLNPAAMQALEIPWRVDARWCQALTSVGAVVATVLWTRPVRTRDAHQFGLDARSAWRAWLPVLQLGWLVHAALLVLGALTPPAARGQPATDEQIMRWANIVGIVSQVPWILAMRHVASLADYLRDGRVRKSVNAWTWIWIAALVLTALQVPIDIRYRGVGELRLDAMILLTRVGLLWAGLNGAVVAWLCANALTMAHEQVARDERRAENEQSRYRVPD